MKADVGIVCLHSREQHCTAVNPSKWRRTSPLRPTQRLVSSATPEIRCHGQFGASHTRPPMGTRTQAQHRWSRYNKAPELGKGGRKPPEVPPGRTDQGAAEKRKGETGQGIRAPRPHLHFPCLGQPGSRLCPWAGGLTLVEQSKLLPPRSPSPHYELSWQRE